MSGDADLRRGRRCTRGILLRREPTAETRREFAEQRRRYRLLFACSTCVHCDFDDMSCSMDYPNTSLRHAEEAMDSTGLMLFCKYFEVN